MRHWTGLLGVALGLACVECAPAQPFIPPGQVRSGGISVEYSKRSRNASFGLSYNSSYYNGYYAYPNYYPVRPTYTQIIVYSPPPPPPTIVLSAPLAPVDWEGLLVPPPRRPPAKEPDPPMKKPDPPKEKPREQEKPKEQPPPEKPRFPRPQQPNPDPAVEQEQLVLLGRIAFAEQLHGLAVERFTQAIEVIPNQPGPWFLLGQSYLAVGKYRQAVEAILSGLARAPDWPRVPFQPLQLYGDHPADYSEHLQALEDALRKHPDDPNLLFLQGYQLWFDGRQAEAVPYFERVLPAFPNKGIDKFLQAVPGTQVL